MEVSKRLSKRLGWPDILRFPPETFPGLESPERWAVGVWTGPNKRDLCVIPCHTHLEAEICLSPNSRTITGAIIRAWLKFILLERLSVTIPTRNLTAKELSNAGM